MHRRKSVYFDDVGLQRPTPVHLFCTADCDAGRDARDKRIDNCPFRTQQRFPKPK
jgi:hypothetical protein